MVTNLVVCLNSLGLSGQQGTGYAQLMCGNENVSSFNLQIAFIREYLRLLAVLKLFFRFTCWFSRFYH